VATNGGEPARPRVRWAVRGQTTVKPKNDSFTIDGSQVWRANEDRFRIAARPGTLLAAVADGAGASGLYCGPWAATLVERLPPTPIAAPAALDGWMADFCLEFRREHAAKAGADARRHAKFIREGSCSTLSACWLATDGNGCRAHWLGFGDSPIMLFDRSGPDYAILDWHPRPLALMERDPHLLNWKDMAPAEGFRAGCRTLPARACVVLASDAVGLYLLGAYMERRHDGDATSTELSFRQEFRQLAGSSGGRRDLRPAKGTTVEPDSFAAEMSTLRKALRTPESFTSWQRQRYEAGLMANDDATVVVMDVDIRYPDPCRPSAPQPENSP
jgi:hypothetical protein